MKRILFCTLLLLMACRAFTPASTPTPTPLPTRTPLPPTATLTASPPPPTNTFTPLPPTLTPTHNAGIEYDVRLHPDGPLYVGDKISLEVISPDQIDLQGQSVEVEIVEAQGSLALEAPFDRYGIGGRSQATLMWAWDTSRLSPGDYEFEISVPSQDLTWTETLTLLPADLIPPPEPDAAWAHAETDCCIVYYISGTAVDRDLTPLLEVVEEQADNAARQMGVEVDKPIGVTFLPRVLGHGGFAAQEISVSNLDRNYAGNHPAVVLHHEIVHELDSRLGGELRPTLLIEGLAVYLTGGHFKLEPLMPRAAALLAPEPGCSPASGILVGRATRPETRVCGLGWYLPLLPLLDNFYLSQHEVGYLQAAALVEYMVDDWGWKAFEQFYRDIHPQPEPVEPAKHEPGPQARAVNAALVAHFGITVQQLEQGYLAALEQETLLPELVEDVRLSVGFYDAVRRYQQVLDPSAYFLTAWLPDGAAMREQGLVADYLRRPSTPENLTLETMLVKADADIQTGDFASVENILEAVNAVLDGIQKNHAQPFFAHGLARQYYAIVGVLLAQGYQPQKIALEEETAQAWVSTTGPDLVVLSLERQPSGWVLTGSTQTPAPP